MTSLFCFDDKSPLKLSTCLHGINLCLRGVFRGMYHVFVESKRHESETLVTDYLASRLPAATASAQPVVIAVNHFNY